MENQKSLIVPVRDQIFNKIKNEVLSNKYQPGEIIPIDRIAREYGVSSTPIREAFIRLESAGLLTLIPNRGAMVVEVSQKDILNIWEMRKLIEPYAGKTTAQFDIEADIQILEKDINELLSNGFEQELYITTDENVHMLFFKHIDNNFMLETIQKINNLALRMRYQAENFTQRNESIMREVCTEHLQILDCLRSKDTSRIENAIYNHLEHGELRTLRSRTVNKPIQQ